MSEKRIRLKRIAIKMPNEFRCNALDVEAYYSLGGMNYFTGRSDPRGYWFSIQPVYVDGCCTSFTAFTGVKHLLKETARFSQKAMDSAASDPAIERYTAEFMQQHGLEAENRSRDQEMMI